MIVKYFPDTINYFDASRHNCFGVLIFFSLDAIVMVVNWSKTMQARDKATTTISLSALGKSQLCPWKALKAMLNSRSLNQDLPLFRFLL